MNRILKKWLKIISISLVSLFVLIIIGASILVKYVVTPEKLTPIINNLANDHLKTKLEFGSVDASLFGYFPYIGITLLDGTLMSTESIKANKADTTVNNRDTLISFSKIDVWVNPWALLSKKIDISKIEIIEPKIYAYISERGKQNWDIFNLAQSKEQDIDTTSINLDDINLSEITLSAFIIKNANLIFDSRKNSLYAGIGSFNFSLEGDIRDESARLKLVTSASNALLWKDGDLLFKKFNIALDTYVTGGQDKNMLTLRDGKININDVELNATGSIGLDSINVNASLNSGNIQKLIDIIPKSITESNKKFSSSGEIIANANIAGSLKDGNIPILNGMLSFDKISAKYEGLKYGIDDLSTNTKFHIDINNKNKSYIDIEFLKAIASKNSINISSQITNIFSNPSMELTGKIDLNLEEIRELIPFNEDIKAKGQILFDGFFAFDSQLIIDGNYAKISADSKINIDSVEVVIPQEDINISISHIDALLSNSKDGFFQLEANINQTRFKLKDKIDAYIETTHAQSSGIKATDSTSYINGTFRCDGIDVAVAQDTMKFKTSSFGMDIILSKEKKNLQLKTDTIIASYLNNKALLSKAIVDISYREQKLEGDIEFNDLSAYFEGVTKPIKMTRTVLEVEKSNMKLTDATFIVGNSDLTLTGTVKNLLGAMKGDGVIMIDALMKAKYIDINELTSIYDPGQTIDSTTFKDAIAQENTSSDSTISVFVIPKILDVDFDMKIDSAKFGDLSISNMHGHLKMDSTALVLSTIGLDAVNTQLSSALEYKAPDKNRAYSRFVLSAEKIDINSVIKLLPTIDTIFPMIKSLSGTVSMNITADTRFDAFMNPDMNSLSGAINISGKKIELLDGEVFAEIAKMLYFKRKANNSIDSLSIDLVIDSGRVEIFPFKLNVNRYSLAVGGEHFLDNTFNYHISILKSPIPFKMGINVTGNLDDPKIGFGKAKYKRDNAPSEIGTVNPIYLKKWNKISKGLQW